MVPGCFCLTPLRRSNTALNLVHQYGCPMMPRLFRPWRLLLPPDCGCPPPLGVFLSPPLLLTDCCLPSDVGTPPPPAPPLGAVTPLAAEVPLAPASSLSLALPADCVLFPGLSGALLEGASHPSPSSEDPSMVESSVEDPSSLPDGSENSSSNESRSESSAPSDPAMHQPTHVSSPNTEHLHQRPAADHLNFH